MFAKAGGRSRQRRALGSMRTTEAAAKVDSWRYAADRPAASSGGAARLVVAAASTAALLQQPLALAPRYQGPDPELAEALERWVPGPYLLGWACPGLSRGPRQGACKPYYVKAGRVSSGLEACMHACMQ